MILKSILILHLAADCLRSRRAEIDSRECALLEADFRGALLALRSAAKLLAKLHADALPDGGREEWYQSLGDADVDDVRAGALELAGVQKGDFCYINPSGMGRCGIRVRGRLQAFAPSGTAPRSTYEIEPWVESLHGDQS